MARKGAHKPGNGNNTSPQMKSMNGGRGGRRGRRK